MLAAEKKNYVSNLHYFIARILFTAQYITKSQHTVQTKCALKKVRIFHLTIKMMVRFLGEQFFSKV